MSLDWDAERTALLRELWPQGLSATLIGRRLGVSKNAVIGKVHRLGLDTRETRKALKKGNPFKARPKRSRQKRPVKKRSAPPKEAFEPTPSRPIPVTEPATTLLERKHGQCAYIIGEPNGDAPMCGAPTKPGKAWCAFHADICFEQPKPKLRPEPEPIMMSLTGGMG